MRISTDKPSKYPQIHARGSSRTPTVGLISKGSVQRVRRSTLEIYFPEPWQIEDVCAYKAFRSREEGASWRNRFNHGIQALALSRRPMNGIAKVWALIALNDTTVFGLLGPQRAQASTETAVYSCALHVILFGCLYYA